MLDLFLALLIGTCLTVMIVVGVLYCFGIDQ